jgi:hypothetical protein
MADKKGQSGREVLFEITPLGGAVKVTAIDPATGTEATIMGPMNAGEEMLKKNAVRKLVYLLKKKDEN